MKLSDFVSLDQRGLYQKILEIFPFAYRRINEFILVKGSVPVMLVAHLDTVHREPVKDLCYSVDGNIVMSPQGIGGDDRCGVLGIISVYMRCKKKPWLLFTCDEEIGCIGADHFCERYRQGEFPKGWNLDELKMIIELDRKGGNDAVYYGCANQEFEEYVTSKGFETDYGSVSDISSIAPCLNTAAVNLSSGYYNPHTQYEYVNLYELKRVINIVVTMVEDATDPDFPRYEYIGRYDCDDYYDMYYDNYYGNIMPSFKDRKFESEFHMLFSDGNDYDQRIRNLNIYISDNRHKQMVDEYFLEGGDLEDLLEEIYYAKSFDKGIENAYLHVLYGKDVPDNDSLEYFGLNDKK